MLIAFSLILQAKEGEDPVSLIQEAGRSHIPVNPAQAASLAPELAGPSRTVPEPEERASIADIVDEALRQPWYKEQAIHRQKFEPRAARLGMFSLPFSKSLDPRLKGWKGQSTLHPLIIFSGP